MCMLVTLTSSCKAVALNLLIASSCQFHSGSLVEVVNHSAVPGLPPVAANDNQRCCQRDGENARSMPWLQMRPLSCRSLVSCQTAQTTPTAALRDRSCINIIALNVLQAPGRALTAAEDSDSDAEGDDLGGGSAMGGMYDVEEMEVSLEDEEALAAFMVSIAESKDFSKLMAACICC